MVFAEIMVCKGRRYLIVASACLKTGAAVCQRTSPQAGFSVIIGKKGGLTMENWKRDSRKEIVMVDVEALVPQDHLLRKIEKVMDYDWLYERLRPYYCENNGRPGTDPVVLIKMVLIQHLFGIPSLRQTHRDIQVNVAYRWFLGYSLLEEIPHFATASYAFCKRFPPELSEEIFAHILSKALNHRMVDPSMIFIDGTHIKASANKKKFQKEQVAKAAKVYEEQLRKEVAEERKRLGKKETGGEDDENSGGYGGGTVEKTVSKTDPDCGMFVKGSRTAICIRGPHGVRQARLCAGGGGNGGKCK